MVQRNLEEFQLLAPERIAPFRRLKDELHAAIARGISLTHLQPRFRRNWQREIKEQKMKHHASVIDKTTDAGEWIGANED